MKRNRNRTVPSQPTRRIRNENFRRPHRCAARWFEKRYGPCEHIWLSYEGSPQSQHCSRCGKVVES